MSAQPTPSMQLECKSRHLLFVTLCSAQLHCLMQQYFSSCSVDYIPSLLELGEMHHGQLNQGGWSVNMSNGTDSKCIATYIGRNLEEGICVLHLTEDGFGHCQV